MGTAREGTILFLHGITESLRYFERRVAALGDRYELLIPDLPGFGLSPKPVARYSMDLFRDAVDSFVDARVDRAAPLHIVGHSLGTLIALEYAARRPARVRSLALLNLPRHSSSREAHRYFHDGSYSYRKLMQQHSLRASLGQLRRTGLTMSLRYARRLPLAVLIDSRKFTHLSLTSTLENCLLHYRVDQVLDRVPRVPTLLIHGDRDQVAPFVNVRDLPVGRPWMRLLVIRGSGHHVLHTHDREVLQAIGRFLASPPA